MRRDAGLQRLHPARSAQAPAVSRFEPRKAEFRMRSREVVAARLAERQEFRRYSDARDVNSKVVSTGVASAIAVKAGQRPIAAGLQRTAEHVLGYVVAVPFHIL